MTRRNHHVIALDMVHHHALIAEGLSSKVWLVEMSHRGHSLYSSILIDLALSVHWRHSDLIDLI